MNIHAIINSSFVNGPGKRTVIWTQGCTKGCKNCFNPETWSDSKNIEMDVYELFFLIINNNCDGLTLTGGDPLEQAKELLELLVLLKEINLPKGIILYSGYTFDQIQKLSNEATECLKYIDVLIDGKYIEKYKIKNTIKGSSNQNIHFFTDKIKEDELFIDKEIEIGYSDKIYVTGFPVLNNELIKKLGVKMD